MPVAPNNSRIILELEAGADPIRGNIEHRDGTCEPFWGWLELIEELRRAAANEPRRPPQPYVVTGTSPSDAAARERRPDDPHTKEQR
jgi:hypothetical protein